MRYHGILAPAARDRALVVRRPKSGQVERSSSYALEKAGGRRRVLDVVLRADVIDKILDHLNRPTVRYHLESSRSFVDAA